VLEEPLRHIQGSIGTSGALIHNRSGRGLAPARDGELPEAVWTRISATVLCRVQCNNRITGAAVFSASTQADCEISCMSGESLFHRMRDVASGDATVRSKLGSMRGRGEGERACSDKGNEG